METQTFGLLHLDADTLGYLLRFVEHTDVLHLFQSGNSALRAGIALGSVDFVGVFKPSGFVDCNANLRFLTAFPRLKSLNLSTLCPDQRVLAPIDWTIASSKLTSLTLKFCGCIDSLLALEATFATRFASLSYLSLTDPGSSEREQPHDDVDFSIFPRGLTHLELHSDRRTPLLHSSFAHLPACLLTLILDVIAIQAPFNDQFSEDEAMTLPMLPDNLEFLHLRNDPFGNWLVSFNKLPATLQVFKLCGTAFHSTLVHKAHDTVYSVVDMQGIERLSALREIDCEYTLFPFSAFKSLPSHIKDVNVDLRDDSGHLFTADDPNENFDTLKPLKSFTDSPHTDVEDLAALLRVFGSPGFRLTDLSVQTMGVHVNELPPTLTHLQILHLNAFAPLLRVLSFSECCIKDYDALFQGLPATLEQIATPYDELFWKAVCARCDAGTLPHLRKMDFTHSKLIGSSNADNESQIPLQLRDLSLILHDATDSFLNCLQKSHISSLSVQRLSADGLEDESRILCNLPETLKSLSVLSALPPPTNVNWPTGLHTLNYWSQSLSTYFKAGTAFKTLPKSLVSLLVENQGTKSHLNVFGLPQTLSEFQITDRGALNDYYPTASQGAKRYFSSKQLAPLAFCSLPIGFSSVVNK